MPLYLFPLSLFFLGDIFQFSNIEIETQNIHIWHLENSDLEEILDRKVESVCFFTRKHLKSIEEIVEVIIRILQLTVYASRKQTYKMK